MSNVRSLAHMDWIPALLKHLSAARSAVGAAFVTSLVMYLGPRLAPAFVDPVPKEWAWVVPVVLVFSGSMLLFWTLSAVWNALKRRWAAGSALLASFDLSPLEADFLHALGSNPSEPLDLNRVDYEAMQLSRLEVMELVTGLSKKGLVRVNPYSLELVSLTATGRQRALKIQREAKRNAT
jgi:DNA-binding MarR family transcriptional regulator